MDELPPWHQKPVHHIAIKVADLGAAERFYHGALQLPLLTRHSDAQGQPRSIWLGLGGGTILMLEKGTTRAGAGGWHLVALSISLADRQRVEAALQERAIAITGRTAFSLYVEDPEGNRVAFSHWPDAST